MDARARILAAIVGAAVLLVLVAWYAVSRSGLPRAPRPDAGSSVPSGAPVELAEPDDASETAAERAAGSSAPAPEAATGVLVVRVEAEADGTPLAGIEVRVGRERGGDKHLAAATTDARGEARFERVEANTLIVEARRSPPHARAFAAAWLVPGEEEVLVLRMGAGSSVRGRVVDDLGAPVAGAEILARSDLKPRFGDGVHAVLARDVAATSGADGRFELRHLAPEPREVWIERGLMAPRRWSWPGLVVRLGDVLVDVLVDVAVAAEPGLAVGEDADVGDVLLARAATFAGIVVDARGDPVAGALLSTLAECGTKVSVRCADWRLRPEDRPGAAGFELFAGEALTRADGAFVLVARGDAGRVEVRTLDGARHEYALPAAGPGTLREGLRFELRDVHVLVLELVDARGERVIGPRRGTWPGSPEARLRLERGDYARRLVAERDGTFRIQTPAADGAPRFLHLKLGGYLPAEVEIGPGVEGVLRIELVELPTLRVRVRFEDAPADETSPKDVYWLRPAPVGADDPRAGAFGSTSVHAAREPREVAIVLEVDAPHLVTVKRYLDSWSRVYGPFAPGSEAGEILIPRPGPVVAPPPGPERATVRLEVRDAATEARLEPEIRVERPPGSEDWHESIGWSAKGPTYREVPSGPQRIRVAARDYEASEPIETNYAPRSEHDLGIVRLRPLPRVEVVVLAAEGSTLARDVWLSRWDDEQGRPLPLSSASAVEGRATVRGDASGVADVLVAEMPESSPESRRWQTAAVERRADGTLEVRLAPWVRVEARVPAALELERAARIAVTAHVRGSMPQEFRELAPEPGVRRFAAWVPAGTARIAAEGPLHPRRERAVELSAGGPEPVVVNLAP